MVSLRKLLVEYRRLPSIVIIFSMLRSKSDIGLHSQPTWPISPIALSAA